MSGLVIGYDGSDGAHAALDTGLRIAARLGVPVVIAFGFEVNPMGGEVTDYARALHEHAEDVLGDALVRAGGHGVELETAVIEQSAAHALAELARERDADAIVVGTRGESPLRGALVGAVPHKLLQIADRPVLVVPVPRAEPK